MNNPTSLVLELQVLAQSSNTDLPELIRRAKAVAVKLKLTEIQAWLDSEMNGYGPDNEVPKYRNISTVLMWRNKYNPPQPVGMGGDNKLARHFAHIKVRQSLAELSHVAASEGNLTKNLSPQEFELLGKCMEDIDLVTLYRDVSRSGIVGILEAVRNRILDWALELESQNVLGEGMTFSKAEEKAAAAINNHFYGPTIQGNNGNLSSIVESSGAMVTIASGHAKVKARLQKAIEATGQNNESISTALKILAESINESKNIQIEQKQEVEESLAFLAEQCALPEEQRQPHGVIKSVALTLRSGLSLVADLQQVWSSYAPVIYNYLSLPFS